MLLLSIRELCTIWIFFQGKAKFNEEATIQIQQQSDLRNICSEIYNTFQGFLSWQWDDRYGTALAEFQVYSKDNIRALVEPYLDNTWDSSNIETAPDTVQMIATRLGGLRGEQLLFTSDPNQNILLYGAWWPWGNGDTISLRIALHVKNVSDTELTELKEQFRGWFSL